MKRVYIDANVWGKAWFRSALEEMKSVQNIIFVESTDPKSHKEKSTMVAYLRFLKALESKSRVEYAPKGDVNAKIKYICSNEHWQKHGDCCDDPHIFAIVAVKNVSYVFSEDGRMGKCKDLMQKKLDQACLQFKRVFSSTSYGQHKMKLIK